MWKNTPKAAQQVINNMFRVLGDAGWDPIAVYDGEETERVTSVKEAIEVIDSVEYSVVKFKHPSYRGIHNVVLVPCNGEDVISDYSETDQDNFATLMGTLT